MSLVKYICLSVQITVTVSKNIYLRYNNVNILTQVVTRLTKFKSVDKPYHIYWRHVVYIAGRDADSTVFRKIRTVISRYLQFPSTDNINYAKILNRDIRDHSYTHVWPLVHEEENWALCQYFTSASLDLSPPVYTYLQMALTTSARQSGSAWPGTTVASTYTANLQVSQLQNALKMSGFVYQ